MSQSERNAAICKLYVEGKTLQECGDLYGISRERVRQILRKAQVYRKDRQHEKRDGFLGVSLPLSTKIEVEEEADRQGVSVSKLTSDALDAMLDARKNDLGAGE